MKRPTLIFMHLKIPDFKAPDLELPPLIVETHGGPTAAASRVLNLGIQYWTSRGFALVDVDYRGSTGFGREYREKIYNNWDVAAEDCANLATYLSEKGFVNKEKLICRGSSAGGYTALALLTFLDVFKAGASYYGISDLESLTKNTHKFEYFYVQKTYWKISR